METNGIIVRTYVRTTTTTTTTNNNNPPKNRRTVKGRGKGGGGQFIELASQSSWTTHGLAIVSWFK